MGTIIYESGLPNKWLRPSRIVPGWGIERTAWNIIVSERKRVSVGENGLYGNQGKIPWSRLTAFHLRRLGVTSIEVADHLDLVPLLRAVSSAKNAADLADPENGIFTLNLGEIESVKAFIQHPKTAVADIYALLTGTILSNDKTEAIIKELEKRGALNADNLSPYVLCRSIPFISSADQLRKIIISTQDKQDPYTKRAPEEAFKRLRIIRPDGFLVDLTPAAIADYASPSDLSLLPTQNRTAAREIIEITQAKIESLSLKSKNISYSPLPGFSTQVLIEMEKLFVLGTTVVFDVLPVEALAAVIQRAIKATGDSPAFDRWLKQIISGNEATIIAQLKTALVPLIKAEPVGFLYCQALEALGEGNAPEIRTYYSAPYYDGFMELDA